ncbi:tRNA 4-thiouridine(8) synthase ThiI [Paenibacillus doosanensis]|uniref:tRNA uracil 4-sulfurtransferase ThiI n=1 Tax=Paenibacillus doosanensis TaxID=1229154 RepID=UPI00217F8FC0|nr:tRNA uracil 4-sulfurtransferase ThiI [Paenibacillus doosanensis]MCS7463443.1 tRNA 4-thiouridine(8) synthase ThiI [Paenibacillus doosanensis]
MKPDVIVLRLGELTLKGKNRHRFEKAVYEQIRRAMRPYEKLTFVRDFGRVYVELNGESYADIEQRLRNILGLASFSPVYSAPLELEAIEAAALAAMGSLDEAPATFKVTVRRVNKRFPYDSQEMNKRIGGAVLRAMPELKVDVNAPAAELKIELREQRALIYSRVIQGVGGFPLGTNGKAMLMLSGGIDSPVAGYLALRQGLKLEAVHFHSYPFTSEKSQQKVKELVSKLAEYAGDIKLHLVPFTNLQTRVHQAYKQNLLITILRRAMFRITEKLAEEQKASAIVTGESLGQVASQTLGSMNVIGRAVGLPVLQPLICMEKQEIIRVAEMIDTFTISIQPHEDCCTLFLPPSPSTNPNLRVVESIEGHMDWLQEEIDKAVTETQTVWIGAGKQAAFSDYF